MRDREGPGKEGPPGHACMMSTAGGGQMEGSRVSSASPGEPSKVGIAGPSPLEEAD